MTDNVCPLNVFNLYTVRIRLSSPDLKLNLYLY